MFCEVIFPFPSLTLGQIKSLSRKIEERERLAAKLERSIKVARVSALREGSVMHADSDLLVHQDNWHPALQDLVTSIGKRFSEAFDRKSTASFTKSL